MYRDLLRTVQQLSDPRFRKVLITSLVLAALLFAGLVIGIAWTLARFTIFEQAWIETVLDVLGFFAFVWVTVLLFPAFAVAIQSLLLEDVAKAVEARWYPGLGEPRRQPWTEIGATAARLAALVLVVNLVMLPLYLALIFVPPLNLALFYIVNGFLLGREYFETVALRRVEPAEAKRLRQTLRGRVWLAGAAIAAVFSIPFLNLAAPVLGTALMLHMFERLRPRDAAAPRPADAGWRPGVAMLLLVSLGTAAFKVAVDAGIADRAALGREPTARAGAANARELIGSGQVDVWNRLGSPDLVRREGPARVWQYATSDCVLDLYLYATGDDFEVIHVAARSRNEEEGAAPGCYRKIIERDRRAADRAAAIRPAARSH